MVRSIFTIQWVRRKEKGGRRERGRRRREEEEGGGAAGKRPPPTPPAVSLALRTRKVAALIMRVAIPLPFPQYSDKPPEGSSDHLYLATPPPFPPDPAIVASRRREESDRVKYYPATKSREDKVV